MNTVWFSLLARAAAILSIGGLLGMYFGEVWIGLFIAAMVLFLFHSGHLIRLEHELATRSRVTVPDGTGVWARTLARISYLNLRIARGKQRFRLLLKEVRNSTNAMPDGVVSLNENFEIIRFNRSARRYLGLKKRRDRGQRIDNLVRMPDFVAYLGSGAFKTPLVSPSPVADDNWLALRIVPYGAGLWLLLVRDITEQTRLTRMRRDFVANASHELRTPLTVISGYLDAMNDDRELRNAWGRPLDEMSNQADRMLKIVAGLLELSRMETADFTAEHEWVDMPALLEAEVESVIANGAKANIALSIETRQGVIGLTTALDSVVTNLLQNAVRYTDDDGEIDIRWTELSDGDALLSIRDSGEGISEEDLPRITERFFRVNRGRSRVHGGTGLGLAIVKHALILHDATLEVVSELQVGSEFRCYFPASRVTARASSAQREAG